SSTASARWPSSHSSSTLRACPRALPGAVRYAPSSRNDRNGNPASHPPCGADGCGGVTGTTHRGASTAVTEIPCARGRGRGRLTAGCPHDAPCTLQNASDNKYRTRPVKDSIKVRPLRYRHHHGRLSVRSVRGEAEAT